MLKLKWDVKEEAALLRDALQEFNNRAAILASMGIRVEVEIIEQHMVGKDMPPVIQLGNLRICKEEIL